jgi:hypothetical protein
MRADDDYPDGSRGGLAVLAASNASATTVPHSAFGPELNIE